MARRLFFVESVRRGTAEISGDEAHHLTRVLRVEEGQRYEISDNSALYLAEVESAHKSRVVFRVLEQLPAPAPPAPVTLAAALIRFERFEWMVEKATELGVATIVPIWTERTEKGLERAAVKRLDRWRKIALESSQQCRRPKLPEIEEPQAFDDALNLQANQRVRLEEDQGAQPILSTITTQETAAILVGPEGGWTSNERDRATAAGWQPVSLGPTILRAETAAIVALAITTSAAAIRKS